MSDVKLLAFSGSIRKQSFNRRLIENAARAAEAAGADVTLITLNDYPLPIVNQDLEKEAGLPDNARALKKLFIEHDGFLIASPEYNSSLSPLLKNVLDWVSRAEGDEAPLLAYRGKVAGLLASSPGGLGGLRGLVHLRSILSSIGTIVLPNQLAIGSAFDAYNENGELVNESDINKIKKLANELVDLTARLR